MAEWIIETMVYRPVEWREEYVGHRVSSDGGKSWIEEGQIHASFEDSFSNVTREVDVAEYRLRMSNCRKMTLTLPLETMTGPAA
jgi:hypothetical protein